MRTIIRGLIIGLLVAIGPSVWAGPQLPKPTPPVPPGPARDKAFRDAGSLSGTIRVVDCNARPSDVHLSAGRVTVEPRPVEGSDSVWAYSISGLAAGSYTIAPVLASGKCIGGSWNPPSRRAEISGGLASVGRLDFEYTGHRVVTRINTLILAGLMQTAFRDTTIHVNNYSTTRHAVHGRDSWYVPNDSFVRFGSGMGGDEERFTVLEISEAPLRYYVRDFNLARVVVRPDGEVFKISFVFEDRGPAEIKGHCSNTTASVDPACPAGSDSTAPDFEIGDARLDVQLPPAREAHGGITYGRVAVTFDARIDGAGLGELVETQVKREIKKTVEDIVTHILDRPDVRERVARLMQPELTRAGVGDVISARIVGRDLVIESYPR
jgi:hypothetical protein